jgi:hypothetical protein
MADLFQRIYTGLTRSDAVDISLKMSRLYPDDPECCISRLFANFAYRTMRLATVAPESVWLHQAAEANESQGLYDAALREYRQVLALAPRRLASVSASGGHCSNDRIPRRVMMTRRRGKPSKGSARSGQRQRHELAEMHRKPGAEPARSFSNSIGIIRDSIMPRWDSHAR